MATKTIWTERDDEIIRKEYIYGDKSAKFIAELLAKCECNIYYHAADLRMEDIASAKAARQRKKKEAERSNRCPLCPTCRWQSGGRPCTMPRTLCGR